jgi:hypothetical protein
MKHNVLLIKETDNYLKPLERKIKKRKRQERKISRGVVENGRPLETKKKCYCGRKEKSAPLC